MPFGASMSDLGKKASSALWIVVVMAGALAFGVACLLAFSSFTLDIGPHHKPLAAPPKPVKFATAAEVGTRGDDPNPGALFHGAFPSDKDTQEREVGGAPARFSGYTTWVRAIDRVQARHFVDAYPGRYLRVRVTVFNRDTTAQHVCACDFFVWTRAAGRREADAVNAPSLAHDITMPSGTRRGGYVYLYVGTVPGPYYIVYNPDAHVADSTSKARGVWKVPA